MIMIQSIFVSQEIRDSHEQQQQQTKNETIHVVTVFCSIFCYFTGCCYLLLCN